MHGLKHIKPLIKDIQLISKVSNIRAIITIDTILELLVTKSLNHLFIWILRKASMKNYVAYAPFVLLLSQVDNNPLEIIPLETTPQGNYVVYASSILLLSQVDNNPIAYI